MGISWTEIDSALQRLIAHEEGFLFQRLVVALAKHKWAGVIATNIHKDGGEDALTHPFLTEDGRRIDIASSLTADYSKISGDAERIKSRGIQLDLLVFFTPHKISNTPTIEDWQKRLKSEYGWELLVAPKEDIIQDLLKPENHWMCREFLGLAVPNEASVTDVARRAAQGAAEIVQQWRKHTRLSDDFLLELGVSSPTPSEPEGARLIDQAAVCDRLCHGERIVLSGPAGTGKTTTLIQLAEKLLGAPERVPLLVSLPEWVDSQDDILAFVTRLPQIAVMALSVQDLSLLHRNGRLVLLLNGWNEVDADLMSRATRQLQSMDRDLPAAGIIVATREHTIYPPLVGKIDLCMRRITESQRETLVRERIPQLADGLLLILETNEALSDLAQTPMVLVELIRIFQAGEVLPQTKLGILRHLIHRIEDLNEHQAALRAAPLWGRSGTYLGAIAASMTKDGRTIAHEDTILPTINAVSNGLRVRGLLATVPDPGTILSVLCAHHVLERSVYPSTVIRFFHQQFQELYAAESLAGDLASSQPTETRDRWFCTEIANIPAWEEPLLLLIADLSLPTDDMRRDTNLQPNRALSEHLIRLTIPVDPIFAAELVRVSGLWDDVKDRLEPVLRSWYSYQDREHQDCALAGMLATGVPAFADIIWTLLEDPDFQARSRVYGAHQRDWLPCLGEGWIQRVKGWNEDCRVTFVSELAREGNRVLELLEEFARHDPSIKVRVRALDAIGWRCGDRRFWQAVRWCDEPTFKKAVREDVIRGRIPGDLQDRVRAAFDQLLQEVPLGRERIRMAVQACETSLPGVVDILKRELENGVSAAEAPNSATVRAAIKVVSETDADWASVWTAQAIAKGQIKPTYLLEFVRHLPDGLVDDLLKRYCEPDFTLNDEWQVGDLLAKGVETRHIRDVLQALVGIKKSFRASDAPVPDAQRELYRRLHDLVRKASWQSVVHCLITDFSTPQETADLHIVLDVVGSSNLQSDETRASLDEESLTKLRNLLRGTYYAAVRKEPDQGGSLKANLACALALFGESEDLALVQELIESDIQRYETQRRTFNQHHALTSWFNWYVDAVCRFDPDLAEGVLISLLEDPHYGAEAGRGLIRLLSSTQPADTKTIQRSWPELDFERRRQGLAHWRDDERRRAYGVAMLKAIDYLSEKRTKSEEADKYSGHLKAMASVLAVIGDSGTVPLILDIMALPGEWDSRARVETLGILVRNGFTLDYGAAACVLEPVISRALGHNVNQCDENLLGRCLDILLFTNQPSKAVARLKELTASIWSYSAIRELFLALGKCENKEAIDYLVTLRQAQAIPDWATNEFIHALAGSRFSEAHNALVDVLDPTAPGPKIRLALRSLESFAFAEPIAGLCRSFEGIRGRILALCEKDLDESQRSKLAEVLNALSDEDAVLAGLNLMADAARNPIPFGLQQAIENRLLESTPVKDWPNAYEVRSRCDTVLRHRLFEIALDDDRRCRSALRLLGRARLSRLEHGMPLLEPRHPAIETGIAWPPPVRTIPSQQITSQRSE